MPLIHGKEGLPETATHQLVHIDRVVKEGILVFEISERCQLSRRLIQVVQEAISEYVSLDVACNFAILNLHLKDLTSLMLVQDTQRSIRVV